MSPTLTAIALSSVPLGEQNPWLAIARHRDGTYLSLDLSGRVYACGRSLTDLALDGCGDG